MAILFVCMKCLGIHTNPWKLQVLLLRLAGTHEDGSATGRDRGERNTSDLWTRWDYWNVEENVQAAIRRMTRV